MLAHNTLDIFSAVGSQAVIRSCSEKPRGRAVRSVHKSVAQLRRAVTDFKISASKHYGGFSTKGWQRVNLPSKYVQENIQKKCYNLPGSGTQLDKAMRTKT